MTYTNEDVFFGVDRLKNSLTSTNTYLNYLNGLIESLQAQLTGLQTAMTSGINSEVTTLTTQIASLIVTLQTLQAAETANSTTEVTSLSAIKTSVDAAKAVLDLINTNSSSPIYAAPVSRKSTIASASIPAATSVKLFDANPNRKGFTVYNNSTNSLYVCIENPAVAANLIDFCGSNAGQTSVVKWLGTSVPTAAVYVIRNAGTGGVTGWEFE
jgi:hypothetical protein